MLEEQFDAVWDQLMSDNNAEIREEIFSVCEEEAERGAEMIITFATDKGLKLDATADELVDHLENLDDDEDIELTPEMLADVAGGRRTGRRIIRRMNLRYHRAFRANLGFNPHGGKDAIRGESLKAIK